MTTPSPDSAAVAHGLGLFETMLVRSRRVLLLDEHLARMARSAETLGLPRPDAERFRDACLRAAAVADGEQSLRCLWIAAGETLDAPWSLFVSTRAISRATLERRAQGRVVTLPPSFVRSLPEHKMTSYAVCILGLRFAMAAGADEGLFVTRDGLVLEGTATNVFALRDRTLITPPVSAGILPGVMRAWVLSEAARAGIAVEERPLTMDDLEPGAFLTGSLTTLAAVQSVNGRACAAPGEVFAHLCEAWQSHAR